MRRALMYTKMDLFAREAHRFVNRTDIPIETRIGSLQAVIDDLNQFFLMKLDLYQDRHGSSRGMRWLNEEIRTLDQLKDYENRLKFISEALGIDVPKTSTKIPLEKMRKPRRSRISASDRAEINRLVEKLG